MNAASGLSSNCPSAAYVIGLDEGYRGAPLEADLRSRGFAVERVQGVLVEREDIASSVVYDPVGARVVMRRALTSGEIGCALAHRNVARSLLASDREFALVCEDDARLTLGWQSADLPWEVLGALPTVLTLFSHGARTIVRRHEGLPAAGPADVFESRTPPLTTTAYMINRTAARILAEERPLVTVADWDPHFAARTRFLVAYPWLARPAEDEESTLERARQASAPIDNGSTARKVTRHAAALAHITWLRSQSHYAGDYLAYRTHEFDRLVLGWRARRRGKPIDASDPGSPVLL